ncbi:MAG: rhomboid family intramembrane serine protease [Gemmatimonadetes bacterium]|nr:rhomboid family intramembrane serine protease [Gemmatimonadota bacterium]
MIPLRDENPTELTPFVTVLLIALNLVAWFMLQGAGMPEQLEASVWAFGTIPCEVTAACATEGLGRGGVLTSMFMHGGWGHLLGNMVFFWVFGNNIEDSMGHLRYLVFYLICGVAAALAHIYVSPLSPIPAVGASGAISGIMGAYILLYPRVQVQTFFPPFFFFHIPAFLFLGYWFFIQLSMGVTTVGPGAGEQGGVAVWAHVGGFVAGAVLIRPFMKRALVNAKRRGVKLPPSEVARLEW